MVVKPVATGRMKDMEMLQVIMEEIRHMRSRLDDHVADRAAGYEMLRKELSQLREDMAVHKTKLSIIVSGIAVIIAGAVSFLVNLFER